MLWQFVNCEHFLAFLYSLLAVLCKKPLKHNFTPKVPINNLIYYFQLLLVIVEVFLFTFLPIIVSENQNYCSFQQVFTSSSVSVQESLHKTQSIEHILFRCYIQQVILDLKVPLRSRQNLLTNPQNHTPPIFCRYRNQWYRHRI